MSGPQVPALAVQQVNDVFPGCVPRIPGPGLTLFSRSDGSAAFWDTTSAGGLPGQFFIDQTIAQDNAPRFRTIQSAVDYVVGHLLTSAQFHLQPFMTYTESVVMPTAGTYEIIGNEATVVGSFTISNTGGAEYTFRDLQQTGNINGTNSGAQSSFLFLESVFQTGGCTLAATGAGRWTYDTGGIGGNFQGASGFGSAAVNVAGSVISNNWSFFGNVTYTGISRFTSAVINAGVVIAPTGSSAGTLMIACNFGGATSIVGTGSPTFSVDGHTLASMGNATAQTTISGVALKTNNANGSIDTTGAPSNGSTLLMAGAAGIYTARAIAHLVTSGGTGTLLWDLNYVDATGHARTIAITTTGLVLNGAVATEDAGTTRAFYHDGSAPITATAKGVLTAGSSVHSVVACRREN